MISSRDLLAAARAAQGIPSNYRLSRVLDVPERSVQRWNTGKHTPDDPVAVKLAEMAGLDPAYVLASMYAQRSAEGPLQQVWATIAQRAQAAAAVALTAILSVVLALSPDRPAQAAVLGTGDSARSGLSAGLSKHCRQSVRRILRRLRGLLQHLHQHPPMGAHATT